MKKKLFCFAAFAILLLATESKAAPLYNQTIWVKDTQNLQVRLALADLRRYLNQSTGAAFNLRITPTATAVADGIYVLYDTAGLLPAALQKKLQQGSVESFAIAGGPNQLRLVAAHPKGLVHAVYSYLEKLGIRFYFPGDDWTVVPQRKTITWSGSQVETPEFEARNFFGTGGFFPVRAVDPGLAMAQTWETWKRRNRMGSAIQLPGHYGEAFNQKYRTVLEQHPEYLAEVGGKRVPWSAQAKWNISNDSFRALFIKDRVAFVTDFLAKYPGNREKIIVAVEQADGYNDCECAACKRMGTVSDRVFFLANEVAKAVSKVSPLAYPNLYAYNTHAAPPSFSLEPNVIVQVIPYAFQRISSPEALIENWRKRCANLFLYDYYGIPDWQHDLPLTPPYAPYNLVNKLKYWQRMGIRGFMLESSFSIGSTGLGLYQMARIGWGAGPDQETLQQVFLTDLFEKAAPVMQQYYAVVNGSFRGAVDVPFVYAILKNAHNATTNKAVKKRITLLAAYMHYVALYNAWQGAAPGNKEAAANALARHVWRLYPYAMVHSTRFTQLFVRGGGGLAAAWNINPIGENIKSATPYTEAELETMLATNAAQNKVLPGFRYGGEALKIDYKLLPAKEPDPENPPGMLLLGFPETYVKPAADGVVRFLLKVNERERNNNELLVTVTCSDMGSGKSLYAEKVLLTRAWQQLAIRLPAGNTYRLHVQASNWIRMYVPQNQWMGFKSLPLHSEMGNLYFFIPQGTTYIYYTNGQRNWQPPVYDFDKTRLQAEAVDSTSLYRVVVPQRATGKWATISALKGRTLRFFDLPNMLFPHPNFAVVK